MSTLSGANDSPKIAPRQDGSCGITPATFMPPIRHTASAAEETEAAAITTPHAVSRMKNNIAAIAARPSPTTTSGLPAVFFAAVPVSPNRAASAVGSPSLAAISSSE